MSVLIDTHAHLDDHRYNNDRDAVLARAREVGVRMLFTIGIDLATSRAAVDLARRYPKQVRAIIGIHPNHTAELGDGDWDTIRELARDPMVIGIGETGLDRYWDRAPIAVQETSFRAHLDFCREIDLPVIIHCRDAEDDTRRVLRESFEAHGPIRGLMHSFAGNAEMAADCLSMGMHLSFSGMITFPKSEALRKVALRVPLDRVMVETDCPYLAPQPVRGKRNEPSYVQHTATHLATLHGLPLETIAEHTTRNVRTLFRLEAVI